MEKIFSKVNDVLRNPERIFNHADLIRKKLIVGKKWNLIRDDLNPNVIDQKVIDLLASLQLGKLGVNDVLKEIALLNDSSVDLLIEELSSVYKTGLLELHITDKCDLDCVDCHYTHKKGSTIDFERIKDIIFNLFPRAITITGGGEPNVYKSNDKTLNDVVQLIHSVLPEVQIGLINNNTKIPDGDWTKFISWQRSSIDASNAETFKNIKRSDGYNDVVNNIKYMLQNTPIDNVGVGFLYRKENAHEIFGFLMNWYEWYKTQNESIQDRFNIQFRSISPPIEKVQLIRKMHIEYLPQDITNTVRSEVKKTLDHAEINNGFLNYLLKVTNFHSSLLPILSKEVFLHTPKNFNHCYNAFIHRVFRANGTEYPDFLLCAFPEYALGNTLVSDSDVERSRIALSQYFFHNKLSQFCNPESCRQSWISNMIENTDLADSDAGTNDNYFF